MNLRKFLLTIEAVVLAGPITVFVLYATPFALTFGIGSLLMPLIDPQSRFEPFLIFAVLGCGAGVFALAVLWRLVLYTIMNRFFPFDRTFFWGMWLGLIATISIVLLYRFPAVALFAVPVIVLSLHFIWLQRQLQNGEPEQK